MTDDTPPVLYISADTSDLTTRYKATPRMHPRANAWIPRDAVRVKPLEWRRINYTEPFEFCARCCVGSYWVFPNKQTSGGKEKLTFFGTYHDGHKAHILYETKGDTPDGLFEALQADYEARIMSALAALPAADAGEQDEGEE